MATDGKRNYRPKFHYTPEKGWINDPNGLVFDGEKYHLFAQHYPDATKWGPMHWAHAVSDDMIHWSEPMSVERNGRPFGNHYMAMASEAVGTYPNVIEGDEFVIFTDHNGTDVDRQEARFELK